MVSLEVGPASKTYNAPPDADARLSLSVQFLNIGLEPVIATIKPAPSAATSLLISVFRNIVVQQVPRLSPLVPGFFLYGYKVTNHKTKSIMNLEHVYPFQIDIMNK